MLTPATSPLVVDITSRGDIRHATHLGRQYIGGELGSNYQIKIKNRTPERLLVVVTVDGKNVVDGKPGSVTGNGYVLGPRETCPIEGWRTDLSQVRAFAFVDASDSYAVKTEGSPLHVGVIGIAVFKEKSVRPVMAFATPAAARSRGSFGHEAHGEASMMRAVGTGMGEAIASPAHEVPFDRATDQPAEVHIYHYDTIAALKDRGILPDDNGPQPFPADKPTGFCKVVE